MHTECPQCVLNDGINSYQRNLFLHEGTDFLQLKKKKWTLSLSSRASICLTLSPNSCHLPQGWRSRKFCSETAELQVSGSLSSAGCGITAVWEAVSTPQLTRLISLLLRRTISGCSLPAILICEDPSIPRGGWDAGKWVMKLL